jgi:hypothetical protein
MGEKNEHVCPVEKAGGLDSGIRKLLQRPRKSYCIGEMEVPVLQGIDLSIRRGEFIAIRFNLRNNHNTWIDGRSKFKYSL